MILLLKKARKASFETARERLNHLSSDERSQALYELHGVSLSSEEDAEWVASKFRMINKQLNDMSSTRKEAFNEALRQNPKVVDTVRLQCLRAERSSPEKAAARIVRHFEAKKDLFGKSKLGKELDLDDLSSEERKNFREGYVQLLSQKDMRGRAILWIHGEKQQHYSMEGTVKLLFLCAVIASKDPEISRNGVVLIYYGVGQSWIINAGRTRAMVTGFDTWSIGVVALHSCHDHPALHEAVKIASRTMSLPNLLRYRVHFGSHLECAFSLTTFDIQKHILPIDEETGMLDCGDHHRWLDSLGKKENLALPMPRMTPVITEVLANDILLGRGQRGVKSEGNNRLKVLLTRYIESYDAMPRHAKSAIVKVVHNEIIESGSRFLLPRSKNENDGWIEADVNMIRSRIAHGFRNLRLSRRKY